MKTTIRPCPFCGHEMEVKKVPFCLAHHWYEYRWLGNCTNPKCVLNTDYKTEEEIIKALNTRVLDERTKKKIENYRKKIEQMENRLKKVYLNGEAT